MARFITTKNKPIEEVTARDIQPGLDAEDVGWLPHEVPAWYKARRKRLDKINEHYCYDKGRDGKPIWKLTSKRDEAFLIKTLKESDVNSKDFGEAVFFLGKYYARRHRKLLREVLWLAAKWEQWDDCYGIMIALENGGARPLDVLRKKGISSFGVCEDSDNKEAALAYLKETDK